MAQKTAPLHSDAPLSPFRRALFQGAAAMGGAAVLGTFASSGVRADATATGAEAVAMVDRAKTSQPFFGVHQSGITNPAPSTALFAAFHVLATNRQDLTALFKLLTDRFAFLTQGGPVATAAPRFPPPDSGIMGPVLVPDNLTVTLAVGHSLFDDRFGLAPLKPTHLQAMTSFPNDALDPDWCHGDLIIQFCADSPEANIHALRDIIKNTPASLMLHWKQDGFLPEIAARSRGKLTPRNMLGFKDGTSNPDGQDSALMNEIVWVQAGHAGEPDWTAGGTYQAVRIIHNMVETWDRTSLREQETIIGRDKVTGAPLGMTHEHQIPDYAADPKGKIIPLDAHMRLANPRTPETRKNLILRRPYDYSRGVNKAGQLEMGLIFNCFQSDLDAGFIAVQNRLNGEPFEEYIKPLGGGYFFVLPGAPGPGHYLGQPLIEAADASA